MLNHAPNITSHFFDKPYNSLIGNYNKFFISRDRVANWGQFKKKIWVQQENLWKITYCLRVLPTKFLNYTHRVWAGGTSLRQQEKSSSSPRAASVKIRISTWSHLSVICPLQIPIPMCHLVLYSKYIVTPITTSRCNQKILKQRHMTHLHCGAWAGGTFLRPQKKVPPAHPQRMFSKELREKDTLV